MKVGSDMSSVSALWPGPCICFAVVNIDLLSKAHRLVRFTFSRQTDISHEF